MQNFSDVVGLWGSPAEMAEDIGEKAPTVRAWARRGNIPSDKWQTILEAAERRGFSIDAAQLVAIAGAPPSIPDSSITGSGS